MSYCRFSTDDYDCDVYCYEHVCGGWAVHIAGRRIVDRSKAPVAPEIDTNQPDWSKKWVKHSYAVLAWLTDEDPERQPIDHPDAGKTLMFDSPGEVADYLAGTEGLRFPDYVITELREEQTEMETS